MKKQRKHYTAEEKVAILRRHLLGQRRFRSCVMSWACSRRCSTAGRKSSSRRGGRLSAERPRSASRGRADRVSGEEDRDQGRGPGRADGGAHRAKKKSWGTLTETGCRTMCGTRWSISSGAGRRRPRSAPGGSSRGWASPRASSTTGASATARSMSTTAGFPGFLAGAVGEGSHHRFSSDESAGRLSPADVHDAGCRCGGGESGERMARAGQAGLLRKWTAKPSKKGTGFEQPPEPHQHWHIDVSYINICGTFYYLCSVLDGYSRPSCIGICGSR